MKNINNKIMVSIICNTYNQEKYIKKALDSFLMQKTNFLYEVIVHEDCGTDNTKNIIMDYEKKYPDIIKPIYEKENQYSKNVEIILERDLPHCNGKYIALCEGDDYWIDENKLQKQVDYMEKNPKCSLCIHNAVKVNCVTEEIIDYIKPTNEDRIISTREVILGGGGFCATNSIFTRKELLEKAPKYFYDFSCDYTYQKYLASCGETFCSNDIMSAYRVNAEGSWSNKIHNKDFEIEWRNKIISNLNEFNNYTKNKYFQEINQIIINNKFKILLLNKDYKSLKKEPYKSYIKKFPLKKKIIFYMDEYTPWLHKFIIKVKGCVKK